MDSIKIPDYLSQKFENIEPVRDPETGEPAAVSESSRPEPTPYREDLISFITWITETADQKAKEADYPGCGQIPPERLGELLGVMADEELPEYLKSKVKTAGVVSLLGGILGINYLEYRRRLSQQQKEQKETGLKDGNSE